MMLLLLLHRNENKHSCGSCRSTRRPENTVDSCLKRWSALLHVSKGEQQTTEIALLWEPRTCSNLGTCARVARPS